MLKIYYSLTKPGIIYGNLITVAAGFILGTTGPFHDALFLETLAGISLIIASGCVLNNIIDRDIDGLMERTKGRALVKGLVPLTHAYTLAAGLGSFGAYLLGYFTNIVTLLTGLAGLFAYVFIYSLWSKRTSVYGTLLGSISGAVPPVVGYTAATGHIDLGAIILFIILVMWQMPHSYAIAIYRLSDYQHAHIPVLPLARGMRTTKIHMFEYIIGFTAFVLALYFFGYAGKLYLFTMLPLGLLWTTLSFSGFTSTDDARFGKMMFISSIIVITLFSLVLSLDHFFFIP